MPMGKPVVPKEVAERGKTEVRSQKENKGRSETAKNEG